MVAPRAAKTRPPSAWWLVVSTLIWVLAAACLIVAVVYQDSASRPIGEGDVFLEDVEGSSRIVAAAPEMEEGVRRARNHLEIEAVSVVSREGIIVFSTSGSFVGQPLRNPMLAFAVESNRLAAVAGSIQRALLVDGVVEWPRDTILYQVVSPMAGGDNFIMLHYDVSELLGRRAQSGAIQALTIQLLGLGGVFAVLGAMVFVGHSRAARRHREMLTESEMLRVHSEELREANVKLAEARRRAERALTLAEEKMRIRSEFVLMINHELRTPLTSVVTGAQLLRDGNLGEDEQQEVIDSMVAYGSRLNEIIDQILAVARIENQGIAYEPESIPLPSLCTATAVRLTDEREIADRTSVLLDVRTLSLTLGSLSDNARTHGAANVEVHATTEPEIEPMLEHGERPQPAVYFIVADDGPGIDPTFLPRAFEKFEKNSSSSGTGLGLYMVRLMVDALGGSIGVSTSQKGTIFQIALPAHTRDRVMETV